ncbi:MAG: glutamine--fructose-6-phosphate transaminase (isomerizing) [Candidatus Paceibacterota bacterium]|jgi:glucosamine--fructose-6-phosphate aminotransferase (isomerizing)
MCGIVGYISKEENPNSLKLGLEALKRLEYRGYDSAGFAFWDKDKKEIISEKVVGRIAKLEEKVNGECGKTEAVILHTRWATTGEVSEKNAHPHHDCNKKIWLVHNGIIENYKLLKERLEKEGHKFYSETDTEVIAHLIEKFSNGKLEDAVKKALPFLKGTYGLLVISKDDPGKIVAARLSSPLLIGLGDREYLVASDPSAVISRTNKVIYLEDGEIATISKDNFEITSLVKGKVTPSAELIDWSLEEAQKGGYNHFMLKEIMEQSESIRNSLRGRLYLDEGSARLGGLSSVIDKLRDIKKINIIACGTARHAALVGEYMLEEYAGIPTEVDAGSEFRYKKTVLGEKEMGLFISQSGETADTLAALRDLKNKGFLTIGITNVVGSSQARETDAGVYNHAGPEIGVASTKAYTSQLTVLALLSLLLGRQRQLSVVMGQRIAKELAIIPDLIKRILDKAPEIKKIAEKYKDFNNFMYIGRKYDYPTAREGAHKIKEVAYIHAEGCRGGELKHCELALIDEKFPTVAICPKNSVYDKMISNIEQVKCRNGKVIAIATEGDENIKDIADDVIYIPKTLEMLTPILSIVPLQLFAYYAGVLRGLDVDKPRNLAKSVTVE